MAAVEIEASALIVLVTAGRRIPGRAQDRSPETADWWETLDFESKSEGTPAAIGEVPFQSHFGQGSKIETSLGASGVVLDHLASRFREAVISGSLDPALISAVEWAFDRHHSRAVAIFRRELTQDANEFTEAITRLVENGGNGHNGDHDPEDQHSARMHSRAIRIYNAVFPAWVADDSESGLSFQHYFERRSRFYDDEYERTP